MLFNQKLDILNSFHIFFIYDLITFTIFSNLKCFRLLQLAFVSQYNLNKMQLHTEYIVYIYVLFTVYRKKDNFFLARNPFE